MAASVLDLSSGCKAWLDDQVVNGDRCLAVVKDPHSYGGQGICVYRQCRLFPTNGGRCHLHQDTTFYPSITDAIASFKQEPQTWSKQDAKSLNKQSSEAIWNAVRDQTQQYLAELRAQIQQVKQVQGEVSADLKTLRRANEELMAEKKRLTDELNVARDRSERQTQETKALDARLNEIASIRASLERELVELKTSRSALEKQLSEAKATIASSKTNLENVEAALKETKKELKDAQSEVEQLRRGQSRDSVTLGAASARVAELQDQVTTLKQEKEGFRIELSDLRKNYTKLQSDLQQVQTEAKSFAADLQRAQDEVKQLQAQVQNRERELQKSEQEIQKLTGDKASLSKQSDELRARIAQLEQDKDSAKQECKRLQQVAAQIGAEEGQLALFTEIQRTRKEQQQQQQHGASDRGDLKGGGRSEPEPEEEEEEPEQKGIHWGNAVADLQDLANEKKFMSSWAKANKKRETNLHLALIAWLTSKGQEPQAKSGKGKKAMNGWINDNLLRWSDRSNAPQNSGDYKKLQQEVLTWFRKQR